MAELRGFSRALALASVASAALLPFRTEAQALQAGASSAPAVEGTDAAPSPGNEVVVTGQRLSNQRAIDEKRAAVNVIDVISADDLGKLPDATVADSLARIPGVSTIVNQDTGEGQYVTIRGLSGTYNAVMINGVRVAQTDPSSRDVSLNLLPPYGLASVRVTKTLTPDQDGDAIGGTIDFRTPTAFDFKGDTTFRVYGSGGFNDRARSVDLPSAIYQAQADFGKRLLDDRLGIFVSGNYGVTHGDGQETENDGEWEPYNFRANSTEPISQLNMHLPGIDNDFRRIKQTRYGGNFSVDWRSGPTKLFLRGQYAREELRGSNDTTDYRNRPSARLSQVNIDDKSLAQPEQSVIGTDPAKGRIYNYTTQQIKDVDGDGIITDADRNSDQYWSLNGRSGVWDPQVFQFARNFSTLDSNQTLATLDLGGETDLGRLHVSGDVSYSGGRSESPDNYSISYNCDVCAYPLNATGIDWVSHDPHFPQAGLPAFAQNVPHDPSLLPFDGANHDKSKQTDNRFDARLDLKYEVGGILDSLKVGGRFERSHRVYNYTPIWNGDLTGTPLDGLNLQQSGLIQREVNSILHGEYYYGAIFDPAKVRSAIDAAQAANPAGLPDAEALVSQDTRNTEQTYAGYGLANFKLNALQVVAGVRVEHRDTHNIFWSDDGDNSGFASTDGSYTVVLPSITAVLRPDATKVFRAAIWTGYAPPEYGYISGGQSVSRNSIGEIVAISRGNPDLKPARSTNFDVSAEWYPDRMSVLSIAGYYKDIRNFIFTNGSQVDADTEQGFVDITQPQNGKGAKVYGVEAGVIKQLTGLMPPFDGLGFEGNVTFQRSRGDTGIPYRLGEKIPLINTPSRLYNLALTYQKYGFEAKLSYDYRGKYIESLRDNAVDKWIQPNHSLDLHTRYTFNKHFSLDFDVSNLTDAWRYYSTKGDNPSYMKDYMEPGRNFILRASVLF